MITSPWEMIEELLTGCIGLDPKTVGTTLIPRAVKLRMDDLGVSDVNDYVRLLGRSEAELLALIEEVVIPESWFFRDDAPFHFLMDHVRSEWLLNPARATLRVVSIPCAGGEEPYSIVIALGEVGLAPARFQVDAVDISKRRIDLASRVSFRAMPFGGSI